MKILACPANNFGNQEPGSNKKIKAFCRKEKNAKYDLFAKMSVKGSNQCPLYKFLTTYPDKKIAGEVKWNFVKYLVGRDGKVIARFGTSTLPDGEEVTSAIEAALEATAVKGT